MERLLFDVTFHMGVKDDGGKLGVLDEALRKQVIWNQCLDQNNIK